MLSLSKHLYRTVERYYNEAFVMLRQAQHDKREFGKGTKPKARSFGSIKHTLEIPTQDAEFALEILPATVFSFVQLCLLRWF